MRRISLAGLSLASATLLPLGGHGQSVYPYTNRAGNGPAAVGDPPKLSERQAADQAKQDVDRTASLTTLQAWSGSYAQPVLRVGYATPGDGGAALYVYSPAACSLNGGLGDNGSQVKPAAGSGCWNADFSGMRPTPKIWGAVGDGVTNDTAAVQAAITARAGETLWIGSYKYLVGPLTATLPVGIEGDPGLAGIYNSSCSNGLFAAAPNETLLSLLGVNQQVHHVCFQMASAANVNTAGAAILSNPANAGSDVEYNQINYPFVGVDVTGTGGVQNVHSRINRNVVFEPSNGGAGIRLGANSTGGNTVDTQVEGNNISCNGATNASGILLLDVGGLHQAANDPYGCGRGTYVHPGAQQSTLAFLDDVVGDTSSIYDLDIDTAASTANVQYLTVTNGWASTATAAGNVILHNTGGGSLGQIQFNGGMTIMTGGSTPAIGMDLEAGQDVTVSGRTICSRAAALSSVGIKVGAGVGSFVITGSKLKSCGGTLGTAIALVSPSAGAIVGNDLRGTATPISYTPNGEPVIIKDNLGVDDVTPTLTSAATVTLVANPSYFLSGTTTISRLLGYWPNRKVDLTALTGTIALATGGTSPGGFCTAASIPQYGMVTVTYSPGLGCWLLK